jgi:predicted ribonuclease YlaK
MAELYDLEDDNQPQDLDNEQDLDTQDNLEEDKEPESTIPDKYRGKSLEEIVKMHQEAEKLIGRQAQEVGEVRKLADDLIKQQIGNKKVEPETSVEEVDFFEDPNKAINQAVENNPVLKQLREQAEQNRITQSLQVLSQKHPDYLDVANSADFGEWVKASKVRLNLFAAAQNYDVDSADELLSTYKALKGVSQQKSQAAAEELINAETKQRKQTIKAASVQSGGSGETSQKIFRRSDILRLMQTDRARYLDLEPEIRQAYAEGRVRG